MFLMEKEILYVQNPYQYLTRYFSDIPVDKELKKTHKGYTDLGMKIYL